MKKLILAATIMATSVLSGCATMTPEEYGNRYFGESREICGYDTYKYRKIKVTIGATEACFNAIHTNYRKNTTVMANGSGATYWYSGNIAYANSAYTPYMVSFINGIAISVSF